jgi:hypothetical protein
VNVDVIDPATFWDISAMVTSLASVAAQAAAAAAADSKKGSSSSSSSAKRRPSSSATGDASRTKKQRS